MNLYIDTSDNKKIILKIGDKTHTKTYSSPRSQDLLNQIDIFLKKQNLTLKNLTGIKIDLGPGSFTSLRIGVSVANALSYTLNIPVNGKLNQPLSPNYGKPPNITYPKVPLPSTAKNEY